MEPHKLFELGVPLAFQLGQWKPNSERKCHLSRRKNCSQLHMRLCFCRNPHFIMIWCCKAGKRTPLVSTQQYSLENGWPSADRLFAMALLFNVPDDVHIFAADGDDARSSACATIASYTLMVCKDPLVRPTPVILSAAESRIRAAVMSIIPAIQNVATTRAGWQSVQVGSRECNSRQPPGALEY